MSKKQINMHKLRSIHGSKSTDVIYLYLPTMKLRLTPCHTQSAMGVEAASILALPLPTKTNERKPMNKPKTLHAPADPRQ